MSASTMDRAWACAAVVATLVPSMDPAQEAEATWGASTETSRGEKATSSPTTGTEKAATTEPVGAFVAILEPSTHLVQGTPAATLMKYSYPAEGSAAPSAVAGV